MSTETKEIDSLLRKLIEAGGSDLHLHVDDPPIFRINGKLQRSSVEPLTNTKMQELLYGIIGEEKRRHFEKSMELDLSYTLEDVARFRVNIFKQRGYIGAVLRVIPFKIQTINELGLPNVLKSLALKQRGLIIVTGPTGSGKSTTLAAMIEHINANRKCNIITIEDPIEFVHANNLATISQREVGTDVHNFHDALKHVMRQNPDVVLVGELRDLESISAAITTAETGILILTTLHTNNAVQTVDRIVDAFPSDQQQQIRIQLSATLQSVISQTLLPRIDGHGRIAAFEIMVATPAIRSLLREGKTPQIYSIIQASRDYEMVTLDHSLVELCKNKIVYYEDALAHAPNPKEFEQRASAIAAPLMEYKERENNPWM